MLALFVSSFHCWDQRWRLRDNFFKMANWCLLYRYHAFGVLILLLHFWNVEYWASYRNSSLISNHNQVSWRTPGFYEMVNNYGQFSQFNYHLVKTYTSINKMQYHNKTLPSIQFKNIIIKTIYVKKS